MKFEENTQTYGAIGLAVNSAQARIKNWLKGYLADLMRIDISEVDTTSSFDRYGFDSYQAVVLAHELGTWLGKELDPLEVFNYPSVEKLAEFLSVDPTIQAALLRQP